MGKKTIKCVVWDLDNTLWNGILSEGDAVEITEETINIVKELDRRGIIQSISSKNEYDIAMEQLKKYDLDQYFLYPRINWDAKSVSIAYIREKLNFGIDTFAFIDDQEFEREEVQSQHKEVMTISAEEIGRILDKDEFKPRFVTEDSKKRRIMYQNDLVRNQQEEYFTGPKDEFLKSLDLKFSIERAKKIDLQRVEELTVRTHQLNSTGTVYSYEELLTLIDSEQYDVLIAQLDDRYGEYGKIGIAVVKKSKDGWHIKLLLMSCRVMSKGVGAVMLKFIMKQAMEKHVCLFADFIPTDQNRIMYMTYKMLGFHEIETKGDVMCLEADLTKTGEYPSYVQVN